MIFMRQLKFTEIHKIGASRREGQYKALKFEAKIGALFCQGTTEFVRR